MKKSVANLFYGKVRRVIRPGLLEVQLDLEFGVGIRKIFRLVQFDPVEEDLERTPIMHAMVTLAGGKRVIVEPEASSREQWGHMKEVPARVYLVAKIQGQPVGLTSDLPGHRDPLLEISTYFDWLLKTTPNKDYVRAVQSTLNPSHKESRRG